VIELDTSTEAFLAFAQDCTLDGTAGQVILDRDLEVLDDDGRVIDRITRATFLRSFAAGAKHGQALVVDGESFTIGRRESDDGYVVSFEVHT